ncbi:hypothetical protein C8Q77DRAFT_1052946 [Trametes polyzona]|nr:hypothetical protein C8Q77DRAFT_1052946 [Trametes polyzona]
MATPLAGPRVLPNDVEQLLPGSLRAANATEWKPAWREFRLRAFLGRDCEVIEIGSTWDDEKLFLALRAAYKKLCGWPRWWSSLKGLRYMGVNDAYIYPQRVGPGRTTPHRNLRLRYLLKHPEHVRGAHEFVRALTESAECGVEFVERWNMLRVSVVVIGSAAASLTIAVMYGWLSRDWADGFTIASFFSQTFAQIFVLVGCLQYYEF